jgi:hypothetical protein
LVAVGHNSFTIGPYIPASQFLAKNASLAGADAVFGTADHCRPARDGWTAAWPSLGVSGAFLTLGAFADASGHAIDHGSGCRYKSQVQPDSLTVSDRRWHTNRNLFVGDSVRRLYRLYATATFHSGPRSQLSGWWLQTRPLGFGTGEQTAAIVAEVGDGRVRALTVSIDAEGT